jgi:hypothetical protein
VTEEEQVLFRIDLAKSGARVLNLSNLKLSTLPEAIGQLRQIQVLDLHSNRLSALPDSIGDLSRLQHLLLNQNKLKTLPKSIGRLRELQQLWPRVLRVGPQKERHRRPVRCTHEGDRRNTSKEAFLARAERAQGERGWECSKRLLTPKEKMEVPRSMMVSKLAITSPGTMRLEVGTDTSWLFQA